MLQNVCQSCGQNVMCCGYGQAQQRGSRVRGRWQPCAVWMAPLRQPRPQAWSAACRQPSSLQPPIELLQYSRWAPDYLQSSCTSLSAVCDSTTMTGVCPSSAVKCPSGCLPGLVAPVVFPLSSLIRTGNIMRIGHFSMVRFALLVMSNICKHAQCVFILPCFHMQVFSLLLGMTGPSMLLTP